MDTSPIPPKAPQQTGTSSNEKNSSQDELGKYYNHDVSKSTISEEEQINNQSTGSSRTPDSPDRSIVSDDKNFVNNDTFTEIDLLDESLENDDLNKWINELNVPPTNLNSVKKHSFLWAFFQKLKRFVRTAYIHADSIKITSKDFKEIPKEMIESLTNVYDPMNLEGPPSNILSQYNDACVILKNTEDDIKNVKQLKADDTTQLEELKKNKEEQQNKLLFLSKLIVKFSDDEIKKSSDFILNSGVTTSKKSYINFFKVLKSHIRFDVNKVSVHEETATRVENGSKKK